MYTSKKFVLEETRIITITSCHHINFNVHMRRAPLDITNSHRESPTSRPVSRVFNGSTSRAISQTGNEISIHRCSCSSKARQPR